MKAVGVRPGSKGIVKLLEVPAPIPNSDEILVRVLEVGIDGTDRDILAGEYGEAPPGSEFLILGHESLGRIESIGKTAKKTAPDFEVGDLVVATVRRPDGCPNCLADETDMCVWGKYTERGIKGAHGYLSEYYVEKPKFLIKIPTELRQVAVLLEPISVVEKAVSQAWKIQERMRWCPERALVLGAGPIGLLAAMLLRLKGLKTFVYSRQDRTDPRLRLLKAIGAEYLAADEVPFNTIADAYGRIDFVLEATGNGNIAMHAFDLIGQNGILALTSISSQNRALEICGDCTNLKLVLGNRTVFGSVNANRRDFETGVSHMREITKQFPGVLEGFITRRIAFKDFSTALDRLPGEIKTVIQMEDKK